jgi:hypothetical protein
MPRYGNDFRNRNRYAAEPGWTVERTGGRGYDAGYRDEGPGRGPWGYDRGQREGYTTRPHRDYGRDYGRDTGAGEGGFGMTGLYNRIMHRYENDYRVHAHGSRPAGPTHNWGQGEVRGGRGRRYEGPAPRTRYDAGWQF